MERSKYTTPAINCIICLGLLAALLPERMHAQDSAAASSPDGPIGLQRGNAVVLSLDSILKKIEQDNLMLQTYELRAKSFTHTASASMAWMPPMAGAGTFMTPYPGSKVMDPGNRGNLMFQIEQEIPNPAKQRARKEYLLAQVDEVRASRQVAGNDYRARAKSIYFNWVVAGKKIQILKENEEILRTLKKIEEVRYPYNQSSLGSYYQATAKIEEVRNMILMQESIISRSASWLKSLMNINNEEVLHIDTSYMPEFIPSSSHDSMALAGSRKDILLMEKNIQTMALNIQSMLREKKPDFRIRFDHMSPLTAAMPNAFSVMAMVSIPIAPWSSGKYKSDIRAMEYNIAGMQKERAAVLQESRGALNGMFHEIKAMETQIESMEKKVIPALRSSMDIQLLGYQENKKQLLEVIEAWETLTMTQLTLLDQTLRYYEMIVNYDKELYR